MSPSGLVGCHSKEPAKRDPVSPFAELLWERGSKFERETMQGMGSPFLDLSALLTEQKERETLIYGGRIGDRLFLQL